MSRPPTFEIVSIELGEATDEAGIGWFLFDRPAERNVMNPTLNAEMIAALDRLEAADDVRVVVLTGRGEAWSAGMDLQEYIARRRAPRRSTTTGGSGRATSRPSTGTACTASSTA